MIYDLGIGDQANRYSNYFATGDNLFQKSIKDIYPLIQKNSNIIVEVLLQSSP